MLKTEGPVPLLYLWLGKHQEAYSIIVLFFHILYNEMMNKQWRISMLWLVLTHVHCTSIRTHHSPRLSSEGRINSNHSTVLKAGAFRSTQWFRGNGSIRFPSSKPHDIHGISWNAWTGPTVCKLLNSFKMSLMRAFLNKGWMPGLAFSRMNGEAKSTKNWLLTCTAGARNAIGMPRYVKHKIENWEKNKTIKSIHTYTVKGQLQAKNARL